MQTNVHSSARVVLLALPLILGAGLARAEDIKASGGVSIELSSVQDNGQSCMLSFLAENAYETNIDSAVYETVLFGADGQVALLTLLDFASLPAGKPRVRQFQFNDMACKQISRILINGVQECATQADMADACEAGLTLNSRVKIEVIG
ncbi:hypothetical protein [Ruegeria arenilitoris]|uniref:hypothetical protein n=1 Tax=Ruegeria arenilitoris TaxID=1173585 RepID=UPI0020C42996|nr:hypothetical protein [Ruegeria arenilitoris]